ncbi:N-glycosylase/DNA lyase [Nanohaloarchaea archaeon H01]|nr:N-glycosylase/DNA lyase [Nanohaloarchaea archaeon H01]
MKPEEIKRHYQEKKEQIEQRLDEFKQLKDEEDYRLFMELVFVILSSQTSAKDAWKATQELDNKNLLLEGSKEEIAKVLRSNNVNYEENKSSYLVKNREMLQQPTLSNPTNELKLEEKINKENPEKTREWMVENVKGISWKGASHFLRNIGYEDDFAIISQHILSQMQELGVIETVEQPSNKEEYLKIEEKLQNFSKEIGIEIKSLDLVLWSMKTGEVFK